MLLTLEIHSTSMDFFTMSQSRWALSVGQINPQSLGAGGVCDWRRFHKGITMDIVQIAGETRQRIVDFFGALPAAARIHAWALDLEAAYTLALFASESIEEALTRRYSHASFFIFFLYLGFIFVDHLRRKIIEEAEKEKEITLFAFILPCSMHIVLQLCMQRELLMECAYDCLYFSCYGFTCGEFLHLMFGSDLTKIVGYVDMGNDSTVTTTIWLESIETNIGDVRAKIAEACGITPAHRVLIKTGSGALCPSDDEGDTYDDEIYGDSDDDDREREFVTSLINQKPLSLLLAQNAIHHTPGTFFGSDCITLFLVVKYDKDDGIGLQSRERIRGLSFFSGGGSSNWGSPNRDGMSAATSSGEKSNHNILTLSIERARVGSVGVWVRELEQDTNHRVTYPPLPPPLLGGEDEEFDEENVVPPSPLASTRSPSEPYYRGSSRDHHDRYSYMRNDCNDGSQGEEEEGNYEETWRDAGGELLSPDSNSNGDDVTPRPPSASGSLLRAVAHSARTLEASEVEASRGATRPLQGWAGGSPDNNGDGGGDEQAPRRDVGLEAPARSARQLWYRIAGLLIAVIAGYLALVLVVEPHVADFASYLDLDVVESVFDSASRAPSHGASSISPVVSHHNASHVLAARFESLRADFLAAMQDPQGWKSLREVPGVSVEFKPCAEGWPHYIKTVATVPVSADIMYEMFQWGNFEHTQKVIDPFMDYAKELATFSTQPEDVVKSPQRSRAGRGDKVKRGERLPPVNVLYRKEMRGPPLLPKRAFYTVLRSDTEREQQSVPCSINKRAAGDEEGSCMVQIPPGTPMHGMLDVTLPFAESGEEHQEEEAGLSSGGDNEHITMQRGGGEASAGKDEGKVGFLAGLRSGINLASRLAFEVEGEADHDDDDEEYDDNERKEVSHVEYEDDHGNGDEAGDLYGQGHAVGAARDDYVDDTIVLRASSKVKDEGVGEAEAPPDLEAETLAETQVGTKAECEAKEEARVTDSSRDRNMLRAAHSMVHAHPSSSGAVRGFHDFISWYVDNGDGTTTSVVCMRFSLGPDVPRWLFLSTVGFVSVFGMRSLSKHAMRFQQKRDGDLERERGRTTEL